MNKHIKTNNLKKSNKELLNFINENLRFSVSSRDIKPHYSIYEFLNIFLPFVNIDQEDDKRVRQGKIGHYKYYLNQDGTKFCMNLINP